MKKKMTKRSNNGDKAPKPPIDPDKAIIAYLSQLTAISCHPDLITFCTPGHRSGRGFERLLSEIDWTVTTTIGEEVNS